MLFYYFYFYSLVQGEDDDDVGSFTGNLIRDVCLSLMCVAGLELIVSKHVKTTQHNVLEQHLGTLQQSDQKY